MENQKIKKVGVTEYFKRKRFIDRLEKCLFSSHWEDLIKHMKSCGYSRRTIYPTIEYTLPFIEYASKFGIFHLGELTDKLVEEFLKTLQEHPRKLKETRRSLHLVMKFLREQKVIKQTSEYALTQHSNILLENYTSFLRNHRGLSSSRIREHRRYISKFLEMLAPRNQAEDMYRLEPKNIHQFIATQIGTLSRYGRKSMFGTLRVFLRYILLQGYLTRDLISCVPVIPEFKLDRLPSVIAREDIERILLSIDRLTPVGRRDYAMLLLLATYGLRAKQICKLCLEDIDWRHETLRIPAIKGGSVITLPLNSDVGEAIIDYLRNGRPHWPAREIFLRVRAPIRPLHSHSVTLQIRRYAKLIGLKRPFSAHTWRHACATKILTNGHSLKTIRDVMGHKNIATTFIYTKVDIDMLRQAALDWPEVPKT